MKWIVIAGLFLAAALVVVMATQVKYDMESERFCVESKIIKYGKGKIEFVNGQNVVIKNFSNYSSTIGKYFAKGNPIGVVFLKHGRSVSVEQFYSPGENGENNEGNSVLDKAKMFGPIMNSPGSPM